MFYIAFMNTKRPFGYNLTDGGEGAPGHSVSEQGRLRMRLSHIGKKQAQETVENRRKPLTAAHARKSYRFSKGHKPWCAGLRQKLCKYGHNFVPRKHGGGCLECHRIREQLRRTQKGI